MQLVIFAVSVAVAACQAPEPQPRKYCCTPPQWEGIQAGMGGYVTKGEGQGLTTFSSVAFDRDGRRIFGYTNTTTGQGTYSTKIIQDFKSGYQWTIDVKKNQCVKSKLTERFNEGCIPDDAKEIGSLYFGAGSEMLHGKSYALRIQASGSLMDVTLTVTEKQCIPISEGIIGKTNNVPMVLSIGFVNITPGIKDPSVFTPPSICKQNSTIELPPSHIESQFRVFHL